MNESAPKDYDEFRDGNVNVPPVVSLYAFGKNRVDEIFMLHDAIEEPPAKGQVFQRLPKHMRRRQMSHFDSRLPKKIRSAICAKNKEAPSKRPSRKFRRKPRNLLQDYIRRQRNAVWLETHIWHRKRFRLEEIWGYKLPIRPTNKAFRLNYRASAKHCLLLDISYHNCIEIIGKEADILSGLQPCVNLACGLTFAAQYFLDGSREGSTAMFHPNSYPYKVIGQVHFLWKPVDNPGKRWLWLWVHPSQHDEVVACLKKIFNLSMAPIVQECVQMEETKETLKLQRKNVPFARVPSFTSDKITVNLLKDTLNRFRLIGPLSSSVLADALRPASHVTRTTALEVHEIPAKRARLAANDLNPKSLPVLDSWKWLMDLCNSHDWSNSWMAQEEKFEILGRVTSPTQFPSHAVLSLLALDPRQSRPIKRMKSVPSPEGVVPVVEWNSVLSRSLIWDPAARDAATFSKPSNWDLDQELAKRIVPGTSKTGAVVPILLIQRPGCRGPDRAGYSSGWDVICPAGWAMPLWVSLILRGAKPGGLREAASVQFESQSIKDGIQPDSAAGRSDADEFSRKKRAKYLSLPPSKRPNYIKLGIPSPFLPLWEKLIQYWNKRQPDEMYILRDKSYLRRMCGVLTGSENEIPKFDNLNISSAFVAIALSCNSGRPDRLSHLYLPTEDDLIAFHENKPPPIQPRRPDLLREVRKTTVKAHKKQLRSQRRRRKKLRALLAEEVTQQPLGTLLPDGYLPRKHSQVKEDKEFQEKMADLWLPSAENALTVMESNSRRLMGYAMMGDFGMTEGCGTGLGYILLPALLELLRELSTPLLLFRNVDQSQYRFATFRILLE